MLRTRVIDRPRSRWLFVLVAACGKTPAAAPDAPPDASSDASRMISGRDVLRTASCVDSTRVPVVVEQPFHSLAREVTR